MIVNVRMSTLVLSSKQYFSITNLMNEVSEVQLALPPALKPSRELRTTNHDRELGHVLGRGRGSMRSLGCRWARVSVSVSISVWAETRLLPVAIARCGVCSIMEDGSTARRLDGWTGGRGPIQFARARLSMFGKRGGGSGHEESWPAPSPHQLTKIGERAGGMIQTKTASMGTRPAAPFLVLPGPVI